MRCIEEFVAAGDFLVYKFPVWNWYAPFFFWDDTLWSIQSRREKGDATKARDFLPGDKQYLVTRGVPCLRRATSLAYTDADEDAERLVSFADSSAPSAEGDEWVETHAGRQAPVQSAADHSAIEEIPDIDGTGDDITSGVGALSLGGKGEKASEVIDLDDIPDMEEEDLEDGDEATAAPKAVAPKTPTSNIVDAKFVFSFCQI